jgi:hypothetical protein
MDETGFRPLTLQPGKRIKTHINHRASGSVQQGLSAAMDARLRFYLVARRINAIR